MREYWIRVDYRTGDSFKSEDTSGYVSGTWTDLDIAKENLQRIKEHYDWYDSINNTWRSTPKVKNKPSFAHDQYDHVLFLKLDDGKEYQVSGSMWCGYFETLYGAEIVVKEKGKPADTDMKFTFDSW